MANMFCAWSQSSSNVPKMKVRCIVLCRGAPVCRLLLKCDGTRAETRFRLSAKRMSPFQSAGESVQSTTDSRGMRISGSNAGYAIFRGSVKGTGYSLHSPVSPSLPLPCVTVCYHISTGLYASQEWDCLKNIYTFRISKYCSSWILQPLLLLFTCNVYRFP